MGSKMNNLLDARKNNNLVSSLMEGLAEMGGQEFTEQPKRLKKGEGVEERIHRPQPKQGQLI